MVNSMNAGTVYGISNTMMEVVDHDATAYVAEHYQQLVTNSLKMGVDPSKANDLVHDVYLSLDKAENNGDGYNMNYGIKGAIITVEQFVYGRLKRYSLNKRYKTPSGNPNEISASSTSSELSELNSAQVAYETAQSVDDIEAIENKLSVEEEAQYILTFQKQVNMDLRWFLKNIQLMATMEFDTSLLGELRGLIADSDFADALKSVVKFAGTNKADYDAMAMAL